MKNLKYYNDIKKFPNQFKTGFDLYKGVKVKGKFQKYVICGVGGSSLYIELFSDYFRSINIRDISITHCRSYDLPQSVDKKAFYIVASHSGNTEETISCMDQIVKRGYNFAVLTAGGEIYEGAEKMKAPIFKIQNGIQPRLSTGYFIAAVLTILNQTSGHKFDFKEILKIVSNLEKNLNEAKAEKIAKSLKGQVPIVYATDINRSIARISKIKFNENSKVQSFWNYFPELNHNEMVGYTNLLMKPHFIIFQSKFTNKRNVKRIQVFAKLMKEKGADSEVIKMQGKSVLEEILNAYYFIDHVTYYLAVEYGIDPEPVKMVEDFKALLK